MAGKIPYTRQSADGPDRLVAATVAPVATYRIQLHRGFGFTDAASLVPYLGSLGISTLYLSPVLQARPGSMHGYDVIDPTRLNPELGTEEEWDALLRRCSHFGMTVLLDIVPNHMAVSPDNPWWWDVLENGPCSPYAGFFDIDWVGEPTLRGKVLLPVLAEPLRTVLERGELRLVLDGQHLCLDYNGLRLPLKARTYALVFGWVKRSADSLAQRKSVNALIATAKATSIQDDGGPKAIMREHVARGLSEHASCRNKSVQLLLDTATRTAGRTGMRSLLSRQHYRIEHWRSARHRLNYRRFFDINDLVGMRVEDDSVFEATHSRIRQLVAHPAVCGLRVDHIDGLRDPLAYLRRLNTVGEGEDNTAYILVEKILTGDEKLSEGWPVQGTTGYEFLSTVNGLLVDPRGLQRLEQVFRTLRGRVPSRSSITLRSKRFVLGHLFRADIRRLARRMIALPSDTLQSKADISQFERTIRDLTARLPVYRTYIRRDSPVNDSDYNLIRESSLRARESTRTSMQARTLKNVEQLLCLDVSDTLREPVTDIALAWQQLTGAAMAKGFEDTTLYRDSVLVSLNDVGAAPERIVAGPGELHDFNLGRADRWPHTMNCTSTHDTKRGEDVRARIDVLSEVPDRWADLAKAAARRLPDVRSKTGAETDLPTVLFLLQTLLGVWPPEGPDSPEFLERFRQYTVKAAREAKQNTDWLSPDEHYESTLSDSLEMLVSDATVRPILEELHHITAFHGAINSLSQTLIKAASPGVPDFYQGTELWDLSMVDPDNRRPVDYGLRQALLQEIDARAAQDRAGLVRELVDNWPDERSKLYTTVSALRLRKDKETLFTHGAYVPLDTEGPQRDHVFAFMRQHQETGVIVIVPRLTVALAGERKLPLGEAAWGGDVVLAPRNATSVFHDILTGRAIEVQNGSIPLSEAFGVFPVCLMTSAGL